MSCHPRYSVADVLAPLKGGPNWKVTPTFYWFMNLSSEFGLVLDCREIHFVSVTDGCENKGVIPRGAFQAYYPGVDAPHVLVDPVLLHRSTRACQRTRNTLLPCHVRSF